MRFYVLGKCIEEEKGDIIINLEKRCIEKLRIHEYLKEDTTYVHANGELIEIKNMDWSIKETYLLAFNKNRKINASDYKFIRLNKEQEITLDENYFMYVSGTLIGRITNENEIKMIEKEGLEKTQRIVNRLLVSGITVLVKGKKIYRMFTYEKLKSLIEEEDNQISLNQYLGRVSDGTEGEEFLEQIRKELRMAHLKIENALHIVDKKIKNTLNDH
ncbi:hypothetical protein HNQ80_005149 [Anaerosolibacter carboniphilus]|uniref:Uncharacterized protein n=1 Tax=Anaerosolibacter carboniphilus TaxID=1417629 RepID=A0A841KZP4_9FIRM|nr:hypothetical protein [Anaerosolibacter carboniphilus]MBB6218971.1 hypothetical protein [Anaerosolibacter carboniphilus]